MTTTHSTMPFAADANRPPEDIDPTVAANNRINLKTRRASQKSQAANISPLAEASFEALKPFINIFDPGIRVVGQIVHSISNEDWELNRQWKAYKSDHPKAKLSDLGLKHKNGFPFNPYLDIVQSIYSAQHVEAHISDGEAGYYTSGHDGLCLPYIDLDWHEPWQTDGEKAVSLLNTVFPFAFNRLSPRGHNWFPKIRYSSLFEANEMMDFVQKQLKLLLLTNGILCDIEVKGTITTPNKSGRLAKLPFNCPKDPRDSNDRWDCCQLDRFKAAPTLNSTRLRRIAEGFVIDTDRVRSTIEVKKQLDANSKSKNVIKINSASTRSVAVAPDMPTPVASDITGKTRFMRLRLHSHQSDIGIASGDAFVRAKDAVLLMRRRHGFNLKEEHVLEHMLENSCYSGNWIDNLKNREFRVRWWMDLSAKTFDPKFCTRNSPEQNERHVSPEYAQKHISGCLAVAQGIECAHTLRSNSGRTICTDEDKAYFLVLLKFYGEYPNEDGTMPGDRFQGDWTRLHKAGVFSRSWQPARFTAIKNWLSDLGLLTWIDNSYKPGRFEGNRRIKGVATKWNASPKLLRLFGLADNRNKNNTNIPNPLYIAEVAGIARSLTKCHWKDRIRPVQLPWKTLLRYRDDEIAAIVGCFERMAA